jgi:hypothetical protein
MGKTQVLEVTIKNSLEKVAGFLSVYSAECKGIFLVPGTSMKPCLFVGGFFGVQVISVRMSSDDLVNYVLLFSLCKKTPTTALLSFLKQSFTICKLLGFKNFESLVFSPFLSKTENFVVFLLTLFTDIRNLFNFFYPRVKE